MSSFQVAIDGPAGSGKSTISKLLAKELDFIHIDTGSYFRAITYKALNLNVDINSEDSFSFLKDINIVLDKENVYLDNIDITKEIRKDYISRSVSIVSSYKVVRDRVLELEKSNSKSGYIIMDGRDIGTVILKDADIKFFLTASLETRAKRRYIELKEINCDTEYDFVYNDVLKRDKLDSSRKIAPLKMADDAILLDTTNLSINEVVLFLKNNILKRMREKNVT